MSLSGILFILIVIAIIGSLPTWGWSRSWGYLPSGILGLVLVLVMVLILIGTI